MGECVCVTERERERERERECVCVCVFSERERKREKGAIFTYSRPISEKIGSQAAVSPCNR